MTPDSNRSGRGAPGGVGDGDGQELGHRECRSGERLVDDRAHVRRVGRRRLPRPGRHPPGSCSIVHLGAGLDDLQERRDRHRHGRRLGTAAVLHHERVLPGTQQQRPGELLERTVVDPHRQPSAGSLHRDRDLGEAVGLRARGGRAHPQPRRWELELDGGAAGSADVGQEEVGDDGAFLELCDRGGVHLPGALDDVVARSEDLPGELLEHEAHVGVVGEGALELQPAESLGQQGSTSGV